MCKYYQPSSVRMLLNNLLPWVTDLSVIKTIFVSPEQLICFYLLLNTSLCFSQILIHLSNSSEPSHWHLFFYFHVSFTKKFLTHLLTPVLSHVYFVICLPFFVDQEMRTLVFPKSVWNQDGSY